MMDQLHTYAMVSAPSDIPEWFMPDSEMMRPEKVDRYPDLEGDEKIAFDKYWDSENQEWYEAPEGQQPYYIPDGLTEKIRNHSVKWNKWWTDDNKYIKQWEISRYFAWRRYFADQILKAQPSEQERDDAVDLLRRVLATTDHELMMALDDDIRKFLGLRDKEFKADTDCGALNHNPCTL